MNTMKRYQAMKDALEEYVAEWDKEHEHENHQTGISQEPYSLQLSRQAIALSPSPINQ